MTSVIHRAGMIMVEVRLIAAQQKRSMHRESQRSVIPESIHDPPNPVAMMPQSSMKPASHRFYLIRFHWIVVYILEHLREMLKAGHNPREKSTSPNVPRIPVYPVKRHRKHAQDPLHDPGQGLPLPGPYHEVNVVPHHTEVFNPKPVPCPRPSKDF